jgi:tetratricopeptide (TPR) repeat protein
VSRLEWRDDHTIGENGLTEPEEIGFVICASCGARIKADRGWCLRCHEPLRAFKKPEIPLPSWVHALGGGTMIFGVVAVATVGLVAYLSIDSASSSVTATPDRRSTPQVRTATATSDAAPPRLQPVAHIDPVMFVESGRRATVEIAEKDLPDARARFEQALQQNPKDTETLNNLGLVLERLGFVDTAVVRFKDAVLFDNRNWFYHFNLARALSLQNNWRLAASEYAAAVELFPANFPAQYNMAVALHQSGNEPEAIKAFQKAIELGPGDPAAHLSLAVSLEVNGSPDDAASEYRRYLEMLPGAADAGAVRARLQTLTHES